MTREDILEAAAQVFREKGYHAASMNDIAQSVNLQKASLYHHISSKQEILLALLDQGIDLLYQKIATVAESDLPPAEKIRRSVQTYLQTLVDHGDLAAVLLFEHRSLDEAYRQSHFPRRDQFEALWREMIQEGIETGQFSETDSGLASKYLLGVMNWTVTWFRLDGGLNAWEMGDQIAGLFLEGILRRPGGDGTQL